MDYDNYPLNLVHHQTGYWYQIEVAKEWLDSFIEMKISNRPGRFPHQPFPSRITAASIGLDTSTAKQVPSQFQKLPVDERMFKYYQLCYPDVTKNLT